MGIRLKVHTNFQKKCSIAEHRLFKIEQLIYNKNKGTRLEKARFMLRSYGRHISCTVIIEMSEMVIS